MNRFDHESMLRHAAMAEGYRIYQEGLKMTEFQQPPVKPEPTIEVYVKWREGGTYTETYKVINGYGVYEAEGYTTVYTTPDYSEYAQINNNATKYIEVTRLGGNQR